MLLVSMGKQVERLLLLEEGDLGGKDHKSAELLSFRKGGSKKWQTNELKPEDLNLLKELVNAVLWKGILMGKAAQENSLLLKEALKML